MAARHETFFDLAARVRMAIDKGSFSVAEKHLRRFAVKLRQVKGAIPDKEFRQHKQTIQEYRKELHEVSRETENMGKATKEGALAMINLRDAGSSMVILSDKMIQALDGLRETILDFDEASQQFLVLGDAIDTAIGKQAIEAAETMAIAFAVSSEDVINGMRDLAAMGITAGESQQFMEAALLAATAGMGDAGETGQILLKIIRSFGMETSDATSVAAQLAFIANETSLNLSDMTAAMQFAGAQAGQMGFDLAEVSAVMGIMSDAGLTASRVGTTMRQFLVRIQNPTSEARELMEGLGVSVTDSEGNFLALADILRGVADATQGLNDAQRGEIIATIFQTRGQQAFNLTVARGLDNLDDLIGATAKYQDTQEASNFLTKFSTDMLDNLGAQWRRVEEAERQATRVLARNAIPTQIHFKQISVDLLEILGKLPGPLQAIGFAAMQGGASFFNLTGNIALTTTSVFTAVKAIKKDFIPGLMKLKIFQDAASTSALKLKLALGGILLVGVALFTIMAALNAKTIEMKILFSALTGIVITLAAALFLKAAGIVASTAGLAAIGIVAGLATFTAAIAGLGPKIQGALGFEHGGFIQGRPGGTLGLLGEKPGLNEIVSPVPMMKETFREVIKEETGARWSGNFIVQGPVISTDRDLEDLIEDIVLKKLEIV